MIGPVTRATVEGFVLAADAPVTAAEIGKALWPGWIEGAEAEYIAKADEIAGHLACFGYKIRKTTDGTYKAA